MRYSIKTKYLFFALFTLILGFGLYYIPVQADEPEYEITSLYKPDLYLENVTLDPTIAWTGDFDRSIVAYFLVRNLGGVKAHMDKTVHTLYRTDTNEKVGELVIDEQFDYIDPGRKHVYKIVTYPEAGLKDMAGEIELKLYTDSTDRVNEDFYENNSLTVKLIINPGREEDYKDGYICNPDTCTGYCVGNVCHEGEYTCSELNCSGVCVNNICEGAYVCTPQNCDGACVDNVCLEGELTCNAQTCSGLCINNICYQNICNESNCSGTCINNICHIYYVCSQQNCKGTCIDNVCYADAPPGECKPFSYGRCRINLLEEKKQAVELRRLLEAEFKTDNLLISSHNWYKVVNSYIYGGYPIKAISVALRIGGYTVHPTIPWYQWRTSDDYKNNINR